MHRRLTLIALSIAFVGAVFSFLGVLRIEHMFTDDGISLGWGKDWSGLFWKICTPLGIALIAMSFLIEIAALLLYDPHRQPHPVSKPEQQPSSTPEKNEIRKPLAP